MGRRGPPPKPTALKILRGNPGKRRLNTNEPQPEVGLGGPPEWLLPAAVEEWNRVAPELVKLKVATLIDESALAAYCQAFAHYLAAEEAIAREGMTITLYGESGNERAVQPSPYIAISLKMQEKMRQFGGQFGLMPAARSALHVENSNKGNGVSAFARKRG